MYTRADVADPKMKLIRDKTRATSRGSEIDTRIFFSQPYLRAEKDIKARGRPRKVERSYRFFRF